MSRKDSAKERHFSTEKKQDGRSGADLKSGAAPSFEIRIVDQAEAEHVSIESHGAIEIGDVQRAFENSARGDRHAPMLFPPCAGFNLAKPPGEWRVDKESPS